MLPDVVSKADLIRILNERMRNLPEGPKGPKGPKGKEAAVIDVIRLRHADSDGCNWMPDFAATDFNPALLDVFAQARYEFILKEE